MTTKDESRAERIKRVLELARHFQMISHDDQMMSDLTDQRKAWDTAEMCSVHTLLDEWEDATKIPVTPEIRAAAIHAIDARIAALRDGGKA